VVRAALLYLILAIVATWPLARQIDTSVPHDLGDPLLVTYLLNWNARVTPFTEAWWHPPFFWPERHIMVLSEHLLGLSLVASPLVWLGLSPLAAYNLLFITSFWTAGIGGWVLGRTVTGHPAPAWIAGLAFMFAPYRFSHLPHLQILFSCGVPLLFAALHRALAQAAPRNQLQVTESVSGGAHARVSPRRMARWWWPLIVAACWLWQGLVSAYFLAFLPIAILLWLIWFAPRAWSLWGRLVTAGGAAAAAAAPLLWRYSVLQEAAGYRRQSHEVLEFSADVAGLWQVSDRLAIWGRWLPKGYAEEQLFPGVTVLVLGALAFTGVRGVFGPMRTITKAALGLAAILLASAGIASFMPGAFSFLGLDVSMNHAHKPLGAAWLALGLACCTSRRSTTAWRQASLPAGYLFIAVVCWVLTLGPAPTLYGESIWYLAPYRWLYEYVPGFTAFRVPARLFVITTMALAVLAALGTQRIARRGPMAVGVLVVLASGAIVAEGWLARLPLVPAPRPIAIPDEAVAVLELPTDDPGRDAEAMYRSLFHGRPVANGWSGYRPATAVALSKADAGDVRAFEAWTRHGPLAVVIHRDVTHAARYESMMQQVGASCRSDGEALVCRLKSSASLTMH
jgi:hypothetical protein